VTSWSYAIQSLPWALAGLLVGFFLGRGTAAVETIADAVQEGQMSDREQRPAPRRRITAIQVIGTLVVFLGVFTAVQGYVQGEATERLALCQAAYSNGFADALEARTSATADAQRALDDFLTAVSAATPTQEGRDVVRKALSDYLTKRAEAKQAQQQNPFPAAPRDVCR
jgi:hypothetical protein